MNAGPDGEHPLDWEALGGDAVMGSLLDDFYRRIEASPIRHLFPSDLRETRDKQFAFQSEFWGGPLRYTPWRGHPRMRARHLPFAIRARDAEVWLGCMSEAVAASSMPAEVRPVFLQRLRLIAQAMVNTPDERWQRAYDEARMCGLCHDGAVEAAEGACGVDREDGGHDAEATDRDEHSGSKGSPDS